MKKGRIILIAVILGLIGVFYYNAYRGDQEICSKVRSDFAAKYPDYELTQCVVGEIDFLTVAKVDIYFRRIGDDSIYQERWTYWDSATGWKNAEEQSKELEAKLTAENFSDFVETSFESIDWTTEDICEIGKLEFIDIYPLLDSISYDKFEHLAVVQKLKSRGFTETTWARGNWQLGPRIVSMTFTNGPCTCDVDKLYYKTKSTKLKVTEMISCRPTRQ